MSFLEMNENLSKCLFFTVQLITAAHVGAVFVSPMVRLSVERDVPRPDLTSCLEFRVTNR